MNLSELKNLDVGTALKALLAKKGALNERYAKYIMWGALGLLIFIAYLALFFVPYLENRSMMQDKIAAIPELEAKNRQADLLLVRTQEDLARTEFDYLSLNTQYSTEAELEDLYQQISQMATSQGLSITSLATNGEDPIYPNSRKSTESAPAAATPPPQIPPLFYRVKLKIELNGSYPRYIRFRKLLAGMDKYINIDKEQISLMAGDNRGSIQVKANLSTYRLPQKLTIEQSGQAKKPEASISFNDGYVDSNFPRMMRVVDNSKSAASGQTNYALSNNETVMPSTSSKLDRDPFSRVSNGMINRSSDGSGSPLLAADPQSYIIIGIIVSNTVKAAMIRTDLRESYTVKVGDPLGNRGDFIADIDGNGILLKQPGKGGSTFRLSIQSQAGPGPMGVGSPPQSNR